MRREGVIEKKRIMGDDLARFNSKFAVNQQTGCWEWTAFIHPRGYGIFPIGAKPIQLRAHRWSYEHFIGPIPGDMMVLHTCDNRRCVNPAHLFLGDDFDNMIDCMDKGRAGVQNGKTKPKITWAMATTMRVLYARGTHSMNNLAAIYTIDSQTVSGILKGRAHLKNRDHIIPAA